MQPTRANDFTPAGEVFAVALELSSKSWKIALHDGKREKPAIQTVSGETAAGRLDETVQEIEKFKAKWGLAAEVRTVVLYEAGQDGFWIERALSKLGYEVVICDPASIPVERHKRRAKTDRLDAIKLVLTLRGWLRGEYDRMHVIHVPTVEAEAQRHVVRDRGELQKETQQHRDRIRKLLHTVGCWDGVGGDVGARLNKRELCCYDGDPLSAQLQQRLEQECKRLELARQQLAALEKRDGGAIATGGAPAHCRPGTVEDGGAAVCRSHR